MSIGDFKQLKRSDERQHPYLVSTAVNTDRVQMYIAKMFRVYQPHETRYDIRVKPSLVRLYMHIYLRGDQDVFLA